MSQNTAIVWFRNDQRLHDHEALSRALEQAGEIIPVYCVDPRHFEETPYGFPKTGPFRAKFLSESLTELRSRLQEKGSDLLILHGKPETEIADLADRTGAFRVFAHKEVAEEELQVEEALEKKLFESGKSLELFWGATLYHIEDLPMPVGSLPDIFTKFRKQMEKFAEIRELFPTPQHIDSPELDDWGDIPQPESLGLEVPEPDPRIVWPFTGGEISGITRLQHYFWEEDRLRVYKETRNGLLGADYSSKFSPWLAFGNLSPRYIESEVRKYESLRIANSSTYWMIFELIWRDYFRFVNHKFGNTIFHRGGIKQASHRGITNQKLFLAWQEGRTGVPFVDANMRELLLTGFMSNRGRQNVASFLVKDLGLDWRMGAEWFESQLIDYDVSSNWGNWNYVAGIGNDPRENRYFNVMSQSRRYDSKGEYIRTWVEEIATLPSEMIHEPWHHAPNRLAAFSVRLGHQYPLPVTDFEKKRSNIR